VPVRSSKPLEQGVGRAVEPDVGSDVEPDVEVDLELEGFAARTSRAVPPSDELRALKARALKYLAAREHSRAELARKLTAHATDAAQVTQVLDGLEQARLLSDARFVESLVQRRAARFGMRRIALELREHRIDAEDQSAVLEQLRASERDRALAVWRRKFGELAQDASERARQHRFLAQRGFTAEAIGWVMRHAGDEHGHE
jgi:regulatory protein